MPKIRKHLPRARYQKQILENMLLQMSDMGNHFAVGYRT
jgi:hypothetical protein